MATGFFDDKEATPTEAVLRRVLCGLPEKEPETAPKTVETKRGYQGHPEQGQHP